jgi:hypothetical protein
MIKFSGDNTTKLSFPEDVEINNNSMNLGDKEIKFSEIDSIGVHVRGQTTNLTAFTGIPTVSGTYSRIDIILNNEKTFNLEVSNYEEFAGLKNKKGQKGLEDGIAFSQFLEEKTFDQRVERYLSEGNANMHFKCRGRGFTEIYEFLKDNTIFLRGKKFASFLEDEYEIEQSYRQLYFKEKKFNAVNFIFGQDEKDKKIINLIHDADVVMYLINKCIYQVS